MIRICLFFFIVFVSLQINAQELSIIWPKHNELISDRTPLLSWNGIEGGTNYQLSISQDSTFSSGVQLFSTSTSPYQLASNLVSGIWFWKVTTTMNGQDLNSNLGKFQVFEPTDIADLKIWYNAENVITNGSNISQLTDLSGNNIHAIQNTASLQPTLVNNAINGKPSIKFFDDQLITSSFNSSFRTEFFMLKRNGNPNGSYHGIINYPNSPFLNLYAFPSDNIIGSYVNTTLYSSNALFSTNYFLFSREIDINNLRTKKNGQTTSLNSISSIGVVNNFLRIGSFNTDYLNGDLPEMIIYNRVITNTEIEKIEKYLMDKYSPPVNLGGDITPMYQNNGTCVNETLTASNMYSNFLWNTGATNQSIQVNQAGTYWVQTIDIFGRTTRDTIAVYPPKYNVFNFQDSLICFNDTLSFNPQIPVGHNFVRWNNCYPSPSFQTSKPGTYFIEFENSAGCLIRSDAFTISVDSSLFNLSLGADTSLCSGNNIQLQNAPSGITDYAWNTGNTQASQAVDTSGLYILEVTNTNNCQNRDTIQVQVIGTSPTLQFAFSDTLCQFSPGSFFDNSFVPNGNGTISSKTWSISQGDTLSGSSGNFTIDTSGVFNVTLLIQTQEGCSSSTTFPLVVHPKPIISFSTEKFCPYEAVEFTPLNSTINPLTSTFYLLTSNFWNFDDNTTSTSPNPTHVFGTTDTYNVSLQAEDINGCRDTVVQAVYIQPSPVADFTFSNSCEETEVSFVNNSVIADTFNLTTNTWIYGDGTQAINPSFEKIYADADTFDVELIVIANNGCQDTTVQSIIIYPRPTLDWQIGPACKNTWTTIESMSSVPVGNIVQTDWLVNLQYPLEGTNSAYQFVTTGVQYLNLTSTTDNGCQRDTLIIVNVLPEINASYTVTPSNVVAGISPVFSSTSIGADQYEWIFGFGNTELTISDDPVVAPPYPTSSIGDTVITLLIIENQVGCKDTAYRYLKINEPRIDLAINQLFAEELNGYFKIGIELKNHGVIEITQTDLILKMLNSTPVLETETTPLAPGESRIYLFNANPSSFISTQDNESSFLCVEAKSYNDFGLIETELNNNYTCLNLEGGSLLLMPIFPNPASGDITYSFLSANESEIKCSLTDETGRTILETSELTNAGLHSQTLPMRNLSAGVYYFHISDGVTSKTVKVLKN